MRTRPSRRERRAFNTAHKYKEKLTRALSSSNALQQTKKKRKHDNV
jgi:hypothetical protein